MPENHAICMQRRMKSAWSKKCGTGRTCTTRIKSAIRDLDLKGGLHTNPDKLRQFGTIMNLSTVATDISFIGVYVAGTRSHQKLVMLFAFDPENINQYNANSFTKDSMLCYNQNGNNTLK